jgi:hypothetical protein
MQGIGHVPHYDRVRADYKREYSTIAAQTGQYLALSPKGVPLPYGKKSLPAPELRDVLYSLVLDASVIDEGTFESWASNYGYDVDSRKAEATYRACLEIGLQLRNIIGQEQLSKLQDLFAGY